MMNNNSAVESCLVECFSSRINLVYVFINSDNFQIGQPGQLICKPSFATIQNQAISFVNGCLFHNMPGSLGIKFRQVIEQIRVGVYSRRYHFTPAFYTISKAMYLPFVRTDIQTTVDYTQAVCCAPDRCTPNDASVFGAQNCNFILAPNKKNIPHHNH